jgi:hypothetical protein
VLNRPARNVLWWLCLFVAPVALFTIELFHPAGFTRNPGAYEYLSRPEAHTTAHQAIDYFGPGWWFVLHMIQTPMIGLVAVGMWLLVCEVGPDYDAGARLLAWISAIATFIFVIYYTVLDAIGGIGLGRSIEAVQRLAAEDRLTSAQVDGAALVLDTVWTDPLVGGVGSVVSQVGSWAIFVAALAAAVALFLAHLAPWPPLVLLVAFGWELQLSHAMPHGPIAFALLTVAALWLWWARHRSQAGDRAAMAPASARPSGLA